MLTFAPFRISGGRIWRSGTLTPNSAACERVFSLLKQMFGDAQMSALADYIRAALMLKYNERMVG